MLSPLAHFLRVRWAEVDPQNVVFNGHYLTYADLTFTEYWREAGYDVLTPGCDLYVVRATLAYAAPARYDELLTLTGGLTRLGSSSLTFVARVLRREETGSDTLICEIELIYVNTVMTSQGGQSRPLPTELRAAALAYQGELAGG